jgi:hypothetical protein
MKQKAASRWDCDFVMQLAISWHGNLLESNPEKFHDTN